MLYSKDLPTGVGYYWQKDKNGHEKIVEVSEVGLDEDGLPFVQVEAPRSARYTYDNCSEGEHLWAGPIEKPISK